MNNRRVPDIILERFLLDELDEKRVRELRDMIAADTVLRLRLEEMKESSRDILSLYPEETMSLRISEKAFRKTRRPLIRSKLKNVFYALFSKRLIPAAAFASVIAAVTFYALTIYRPAEMRRQPEVADVTRAKGLAPGLYIYRKKGDSIEILENGSVAGEGDLLQIGYVSAGLEHGLIFSIDGSGAVTLQHPDRADRSTAIGTGKKILLPTSYELDDAPGFETFYFITSRKEIDVDMVMKKAQKIGRGSASDTIDFTRAGSGERQYVFTLNKRK